MKTGDLIMKKLALVLTAVAGFGGQAMAADMAARPMKAPPAPIAVANWTGCYISGGGGYGLWHQENTGYDDTVVPRTQITPTATAGGKGWFGTVQGGCDYQFSSGLPWQVVVGAFADYDFADIKGQINLPSSILYGQEKLSQQWAVGGRVGILITPNLLSYVSGGYTEAKFDQVNFGLAPGAVIGAPINYWNSHTYGGWFFGSGYEYNLSFLPGLAWKTEYRASYLDRERNNNYFSGTNVLTGISYDSEKWVHAVRSQLVYRFNWGGPVVAKY